MRDSDSEVTITTPDGKELEDKEAKEFLEQLQKGVFYAPQERKGG